MADIHNSIIPMPLDAPDQGSMDTLIEELRQDHDGLRILGLVAFVILDWTLPFVGFLL